MALLDSLLQPILDWLAKSPVGKVFNLITRFWSTVQRAWTESQKLVSTLMSEIAAWRAFKQDIHIKTGVISVPKAIEKTREVWDEIVAAWASIKDLGATIKEQFNQMGAEDPAAEAKAAVEDLEKGGFKTLFSKLPKLAKGLERILVWVGIIVQWVELWITLADDLTTILVALRAIREEVEGAKSIFLSQSNRRKTVRLVEGGKMNIRLGNLH